MKIKRVRCKSGEMGEQYRLQDSYPSYEEFMSYCVLYNIHGRLGYKTVKGCWRANPLVQSSTNPSDLRRVA